MNLLEIFAQVGEGMGNSILIFVLTLVFSLPLGLLVAFGRMNRWAPLAGLKKSKSPFWRKAAEFRPVQLLLKLFISILRGTPLMLQLMVVYYGPYYIFKVPITLEYQFYAVIIAFAVNYAAYFAEIYRSGIESMPRCWATIRARPFSALFCRRWSSAFCPPSPMRSLRW